jgi:flagellar protein FliS
MNLQDVADLYRASSVENAPPIKIVRLLYAGAIRFLDQALLADPQDPRSPFVERVHRVDRIVSELRLALVPEHNPEVSARLEQLYLYVEGALARATLERSVEPLRDARPILERLADAWNHAGAVAGETE